ncbi:MAG: pyridoxamine 5'-phosphate oxidase family protein [Clostridia bacterium]|nr:pyridoxamine 5'-phosphate oxidase family protein [Clostridia bacterium]
MKEVYEFLKQCGTYYLATVEGDQPRVRPFGTVDLYEGKLYIQTGKVKAVARQMKANPKVEISAMARDGRWIRIAAEAVLDERVEAQAHMLDAYPSLKRMYAAGDGNTEVYYLKNAVAQICSFTAAPREICF